MPYRKIALLISSGAAMLLVAGLALWLLPAQTVEAQCGSQASSCKNCHEVQGQDPVNNDGTGWHESHAFGDFCYMCHAGNQQVTEMEPAHTGMVPPLSDINAACQQCHTNDLTERAQVYATILGVDLDSGGGGSSVPASPTSVPLADASSTNDNSAPAVASVPVVQQSAVSAPASTALLVDDPNVVDYAQRYDEIVLGQRPVNWGNIILSVLIGLLVVGGGGFVIVNEVRANTSLGQAKRVEGEYPTDVVEMLPALAGLKVQTRKALKKVLANPRKTEQVLGLIDAVISDEETKE